MKNSLQIALDIARSEGISAACNRIFDRYSEFVRTRNLRHLDASKEVRVFTDGDPAVLNLAPIPPSPRRGGSQIQMLDRLEREATLRPLAMGYPKDGALAVEVRTADGPGIFTLDAASGLEAAVEAAARFVGARVVHIENLHGLPFELINNLEDRGLRTIASIHDFTFFCRRPHLIDAATCRFCNYSTDPDRCRACLRDWNEPPPHSLKDYRRSAAHALRSASALIFPSEFLRSKHRDLFPYDGPRSIEEVIPPSTSASAVAVKSTTGRRAVGFVGGAHHHKGGSLIAPIMDRIAKEVPGAVGVVYGTGDHEILAELRNHRNVRIRGYYPKGRLPDLLRRDRIAVAVFPSIWPEAYALVVDESLATGVPVVAFDHGAVGARLKAWQVGRVVPLNQLAHGLARAAADLLSDPTAVPAAVANSIPTIEETARRHLELYNQLLQES